MRSRAPIGCCVGATWVGEDYPIGEFMRGGTASSVDGTETRE
ncbi:MAG: hypothetical protein AB1925_15055 [Actinomycetota bacterium]